MAKRAVKKATGNKSPGGRTARKKNTAKKPIESYDHKGQKRPNNPPVGLVTPDTDPDHGKKKTYEYDPHLELQRSRPVANGHEGQLAHHAEEHDSSRNASTQLTTLPRLYA